MGTKISRSMKTGSQSPRKRLFTRRLRPRKPICYGFEMITDLSNEPLLPVDADGTIIANRQGGETIGIGATGARASMHTDLENCFLDPVNPKRNQ